MNTTLVVFLNVFFVAFVLVTVLGLLATGIVSDRTFPATIADRRPRLRSAPQRRAPHPTAPARRRPRRALDLGA
jgi:hypothetical protein